jgi:uncharacterized membrane protein (UPF0127 family)
LQSGLIAAGRRLPPWDPGASGWRQGAVWSWIPPMAREQKVKNKFYVFNQTRQSFLSLGITLADTHFGRLRGLLGKRKLRSDEGLWVVPSQGIHTIGMLFPIDVVYLDDHQRVIHVTEDLGPFRIAPVRMNCFFFIDMAFR